MKTKLLLLLCCINFSVYAQYTAIPDINFEKALIAKGIDFGVPDGKVLTANVASVTDLYVDSQSISDFSGIEDFTSLVNFQCDYNNVTEIDLSKNIFLNYLPIGGNKLTKLDVSKNVNLSDLYFHENQITSIDLSQNITLQMLYFKDNLITDIDVSNNIYLTHLYCNFNKLSSLDISKNTILTNLFCDHNQITNLDVSNNTKLDAIYCSNNQLKSLDTSKNTVLIRIECDSNQITSLDTSKNPLLILSCSFNQLTSLDLSMHSGLNSLFCNNNQLTSLNLKNGNNSSFGNMGENFKYNPDLTCIQVDDVNFSNAKWSGAKDSTASFSTSCGLPDTNYTLIPDQNFEQKLIDLGIDSGFPNGKILTSKISNLSSLNVSQSNISDLSGIQDFKSLTSLDISSNVLQNVNLSNNTALTQLNCEINKLEALDVTHNLMLKNLLAHNNNLTEIDISKNAALETVHLGFNKLSSLDVSKNINLTQLTFEANKVQTIDVSKNTDLVYFICNSNQLTSIDVSKNTSLKYFICDSNNLNYLNLKNGKNTLLDNIINLQNNPNLSCIQVDDVDYANKNWIYKDNGATFNIDCPQYSQIPDSNFEQKLIDLGIDTDGLNGKITIADLSAITTLDLSNSNIKDLSGIEYFTALTILDCSNNQLTYLDLSHNTNLEILYVTGNPLEYINLQNGNNKNLITASTTSKNTAIRPGTTFLGLNSLNCIKVDDAAYSNANWSTIKESTTIYSETCTLGLVDTNFNKVAMYPNPTKGELNINNISLDKATVYNSLGQMVKSFILNNANTDNTINLSGLPKGVYYVYLINGDAASAKKVIIE